VLVPASPAPRGFFESESAAADAIPRFPAALVRTMRGRATKMLD
jgi:hypothetical protein